MDNNYRMALSIAEAAQAMGLSRRFVAGLVLRGDLRSARVGKRRLIRIETVQKFLRDHEGVVEK